jgi:peptide/nickel transport system permease protein
MTALADGRPHSVGAVIGAALLLALAVLGLGASVVAPQDPFAIAGEALSPPSRAHWFGTDDLGRDVFTGVVHGASNSLWIGLVAALLAGLVGVALGGAAGLRAGRVDHVLMSLTEAVQALPRFFLVVVIVALFGSQSWLIALVIGLTSWPGLARVFRAQVQSAIEKDFVMAVRAAGGGDAAVLRRHVLPMTFSVVAAQVSYQAGGAILAESGLSFLGLGDPTVMSWGILLGSAQHFVREAWWMSVFPGLAVLLTVLASNLIADGFTDRRAVSIWRGDASATRRTP